MLPRPEMNFIRNSISYRGAIAWNSLTYKETRAKTLKELKRCLAKFDTDKMNFEPILATTKNEDNGYKYFWQFKWSIVHLHNPDFSYNYRLQTFLTVFNF